MHLVALITRSEEHRLGHQVWPARGEGYAHVKATKKSVCVHRDEKRKERQNTRETRDNREIPEIQEIQEIREIEQIREIQET